MSVTDEYNDGRADGYIDGQVDAQGKIDEANAIIVEMQHERRLVIHDIKGVYALLNNNRTLEERGIYNEAEAKAARERVMGLACDKLKAMCGDEW